MKDQFNFKRRTLLRFGFAMPLVLISACTSNPKQIPTAKQPEPEPIQVDVSNVKDVPSLIAAIKKAGINVLPKDIPNEIFYKEFAAKFVENAKNAVSRGYKIPEWVLDRLPLEGKVFVPAFGMVVFTLFGALFIMPLDIIFIAVLGSIVLMSTMISSEIDEVKTKKYRPRI